MWNASLRVFQIQDYWDSIDQDMSESQSHSFIEDYENLLVTKHKAAKDLYDVLKGKLPDQNRKYYFWKKNCIVWVWKKILVLMCARWNVKTCFRASLCRSRDIWFWTSLMHIIQFTSVFCKSETYAWVHCKDKFGLFNCPFERFKT